MLQILAFLTAAVIAAAGARSAHAALNIEVVSGDQIGEGFNDPTPVAPVGGNPGTTLGAQRMFALQYAADAWGARLNGTVTVVIGASFDPLFGNANTAILGSASPDTVHLSRSTLPVPGVPLNDVWYSAALFSQFRGVDANDSLQEERPEVEAQFNSSVDNQQVLGTIDFYYGLDGSRGTDVDFLSVALHEIAHGLGFLDLIDPSSGSLFDPPPGGDPLPDAYSRWLEDPTVAPKQLTQMNDQQRKLAILNGPDLLWAGPNVKANSAYLTKARKTDGRVQMYAPASYQAGSSVAHFDTNVEPNELMEPFATSGIRDLRLTVQLFRDLGYSTVDIPRCGDSNDDSAITSVDALVNLRSAVGIASCSEIVCDVNLSGAITAADSLTTLKAAVGIAIALNCPLS